MERMGETRLAKKKVELLNLGNGYKRVRYSILPAFVYLEIFP